MKAVKIVFATLIGALFLIACLAFYGLYVPGSSFTGPPPPLSDEQTAVAGRLKSHISAIASEPHNVEHPAALERSAQAVEKGFADAGYKVQRQTYRTRGVAVRNIWVTLEPAMTDGPIETIVVGGHYDSAHDAPGANDNASGTAATIELARLLKSHKAERTRIHFVAFVNEESPYWGTPDQGAQRFVDLLKERGETVRGMLSLETLGWFSNERGSQRYPAPFSWIYSDVGNFVAFVGMPGSRAWLHDVLAPFRQHTPVATIGGIAPSSIPGIAWSDHTPFANAGIPALMLTDTAPFRYPHYHRVTDTPDKVNVEMLARITTGLAQTLRKLAP